MLLWRQLSECSLHHRQWYLQQQHGSQRSFAARHKCRACCLPRCLCRQDLLPVFLRVAHILNLLGSTIGGDQLGLRSRYQRLHRPQQCSRAYCAVAQPQRRTWYLTQFPGTNFSLSGMVLTSMPAEVEVHHGQGSVVLLLTVWWHALCIHRIVRSLLHELKLTLLMQAGSLVRCPRLTEKKPLATFSPITAWRTKTVCTSGLYWPTTSMRCVSAAVSSTNLQNRTKLTKNRNARAVRIVRSERCLSTSVAPTTRLRSQSSGPVADVRGTGSVADGIATRPVGAIVHFARSVLENRYGFAADVQELCDAFVDRTGLDPTAYCGRDLLSIILERPVLFTVTEGRKVSLRSPHVVTQRRDNKATEL